MRLKTENCGTRGERLGAGIAGISLVWAVGCGSDHPIAGASSDPVEPRTPPAELLLVELDCPTPLVRFADADGDGHGSAAVRVEVCEETPGFVDDDSDCDDLRADVSPSAPEVCGDELDHDCSGEAEACPEPDLDTDAAVVEQGDVEVFGQTIAGDLRVPGDDGPSAVLGALNATGVTARDTDAGRLWQLGDAELLVPGATLALSEAEQGAVVGQRYGGLGRALAVADAAAAGDRSRLYAATGGPVQTSGGWSTCALFWFDDGLPSDGDLVESAAGVLPCDFLGDPDLASAGIDTVAAGFWDEEGTTVAAHHPELQVVWVLRYPDDFDGLDMARYRIALGDGQKESLGEGLAWADLDGDALDDLVATAPERSDIGLSGGGFDVYTGLELQDQRMPSALVARDLGLGVAGTMDGERLGTSLSVGDLDGDGLDEVVVAGGVSDSSEPGRVLVLKLGTLDAYGAARLSVDALPDSAAWTWLVSDTPADGLGQALASVDDQGLAVGAPAYDGANGRVYTVAASPDLFESIDRSIEAEAAAVIDTNAPAEGFGAAMSVAGDVDADGRTDLWILSSGAGNEAPRAVLLFDTRL